jgi:transposase-like protein
MRSCSQHRLVIFGPTARAALGAGPPGSGVPDAAELRGLRNRNKQLEQENEILRRAAEDRLRISISIACTRFSRRSRTNTARSSLLSPSLRPSSASD